jgi:hypothetical protein
LENDVEEEDWMKRAIFLATAALLVMLVLAPVALAQDTTMMGAETQPGGATQAGGGATQPGGATQAGGGATQAGKPLPPSGGPEILLPAAALLLGSGVLTYAVLRRR